MIRDDEYLRHDALGLAELVRRREVSASELLEVAIARAEAFNPRLNAIVMPMYELARERAATPLSGPFAGVPFLTKDLEQHYAGVPTAAGCRALKDARFTPAEHGELVRRWLAAGVVVFGRTATPEFGAKGITEAECWGPTRNPWQLERSPGGSSGGTAAAVAAGIVPMGGANDGGGSIRIPAAATGLFGLKPGRGRTPSGPLAPEVMHGAAINHVLSRSVRDSACMLDATHGPERGAFFDVAPPERPYLDEVTRGPKRLRVAFTTRSPLAGGEVDAEAVSAVEQTARLLESLGHTVAQEEPAIDGDALLQDFLRMWFANLAVQVDQVRAQTGAGQRGFEVDTLAMATMGRALRATEYVQSHQRWGGYARALSVFHARHDLYMTPTMAMPPPRIGELDTPPHLKALLRIGLDKLMPLAPGIFYGLVRQNLLRVPFTQLANLTGTPAMSVPLHVRSDGLPIGIQFVAPPGGEGVLFALAGELERAVPWAERSPTLPPG